MTTTTDPYTYTVGGTVQAANGLYIVRAADAELLALCRAGTFAYILAARQVGKSSLMVRTADCLAAEGTRSVILDLSKFGIQVTADQWYLGLVLDIADQLLFDVDAAAWWTAHAHLGLSQRLVTFCQTVVLNEIAAPVVVFVDEIDTTLSLSFTDDFFAAIRHLYSARARFAQLKRLTFVLIGVAAPGDLIHDPRRTPFNIGQRVDISDWTMKEAQPLAMGLGLPQEEALQVLGWAMEWTGGHPYLTQRLCRALAEHGDRRWTERYVGEIVAQTFFGEEGRQDANLQFVRDMLTKRTPAPYGVYETLTTYRAIRQGRRPVPDEAHSVVKSHLKLAGIVQTAHAALRVRNPIYERVFDRRWIDAHLSVDWARLLRRALIGLSVAAVVVVLSLGLGGYALYERNLEHSARVAAIVERILAQRQARIAEQQARLALSRQLAAQALTHLGDQPDLALLLSVEATHAAESIEAKNSLLQVLDNQSQVAAYLHGQAAAVQSLAFSQNGAVLRGAGLDGTIIAWDVARRQIRLPLYHVHLRQAEWFSLTLSLDGKMLAASSLDGTIQVWRAASGRTVGPPLNSHKAAIVSMAFSPDDRMLATAYADNTIRLWNLESHASALLTSTAFYPPAMAFSPDGAQLAVGSSDGMIQLWDAAHRRRVGPSVTAGKGRQVETLAFSPDGRVLASGGADDAITLWMVADGQLHGRARRLRMSGVDTLAFSPDGQTLAAGAWSHAIQLWDVASGRPCGSPFHGHIDSVHSVVFNPSGTMLASSSADGTVQLWNLADRQACRAPRRGPRGIVLGSEAASATGILLATVNAGGTLRLWDAARQRPLGQPLGAPRGIMLAGTLALSPDGTTLAVASNKGLVLWNVVQRHLLGRPLVTNGYTPFLFWSAPAALPGALAFDARGTLLAYDNVAGIQLWDVAHGRTLGSPVPANMHTMSIVALSPNGVILAVGGVDGTIQLWDVARRRFLKSLQLDHGTDVTSLAFSPDGTTLAAGSTDHSVRLWNVARRSVQGAPLTGLGDMVDEVVFSPNGRTVAVLSGESAIRLWDISHRPSEAILLGHMVHSAAVAFSVDGTRLAAVTTDGSVHEWQIDVAAWQQEACQLANRNLTAQEWTQYLGVMPYRKTCRDV